METVLPRYQGHRFCNKFVSCPGRTTAHNVGIDKIISKATCVCVSVCVHMLWCSLFFPTASFNFKKESIVWKCLKEGEVHHVRRCECSENRGALSSHHLTPCVHVVVKCVSVPIEARAESHFTREGKIISIPIADKSQKLVGAIELFD